MIDRKFKTDTAFSYVTQAGVLAAGFAYMAAINQHAGIETYGALTLLVALSGLLSNLVSFRTNEALINFYKRGEVQQNPGLMKFALLAGMLMDLLMGILLFACLAGFSSDIAQSLLKTEQAAPEVQLYAGVLLVQLISSTPVAFMMATGRFKAVNVVNLLNHASKVMLSLGFAYLGPGLDLRTAILSMLLPSAVLCLLVYVDLLRTLFMRLAHNRADTSASLDYFKFSLRTFASSILKAGHQNLDTLVLGLVMDMHTVGVYGLFRQFLAPLSFLSQPFTALTYPKFVQAVAEHQREAVREAIHSVNRRLTRAYFLVLIVVAALLEGYILWANLDVGLALAPAFLFLAAAAYLNGLRWWARPFSNAIDPKLGLRANLYATCLAPFLLYPMTVAYGAAGTACAAFLLALILSFYWLRMLRRHV